YWYSDMNRTPSWTGAEPFYKYLIGNNTDDTQNFGVYAKEVAYNELELGDIVQLIYENDLAYHNMIITDVILEGNYLIDYLICQHTYDLLNYPLSMKQGEKRYIKILGYYES
ncbi:MAG: amidase domain-containing protein, partial [Intestinibacter sp.]